MTTGSLFDSPAEPRSERDRVEIRVLGVPSPKGSMRAFVVKPKNGAPRAVITAGNDARGLRLWSGLVAEAAAYAMTNRRMFVDRPLEVTINFRLPRRAGHLGKAGNVLPSAPKYPAVKPDLDKYARSTLDSLTGIVFDDDSRVVTLFIGKRYAAFGESPGATIIVMEEP